MMLRIVDVAMIASLENDIVKSNIERVLFVLQNMLLFCSNEHLHMIVGWIARVKGGLKRLGRSSTMHCVTFCR